MNLVLEVARNILRALLPLVVIFAGAVEYNSGTEVGVIAGAILIASGVIAIAVDNR